MTQLPPDDQALKQFLQQHRSPVPAASPDLEAQIMQAVEQTPVAKSQPHAHKPRRLWVVPSAIAASLLVAFGSSHWIKVHQPTAADLENLAAFLETSWNGTLSNNTETETYLFLETAFQQTSEGVRTADSFTNNSETATPTSTSTFY
jgi:hypothetical protein